MERWKLQAALYLRNWLPVSPEGQQNAAAHEHQGERGRSQPTAEMEAFNLHNREAH